jgi:uncharacterized protein YbjT (DUF2867 family)
VLGTSGYIGANLVPRLVACGHRVRAAARRPEPLAARGWSSVEVVAADALDPASLDAALEGIDVAYYLVHAMAADRRDPDDLRVGGAVDSWRVIALEPGRRLTLGFGMKAPGAGVAEYVSNPSRAERV